MGLALPGPLGSMVAVTVAPALLGVTDSGVTVGGVTPGSDDEDALGRRNRP